MGKPNVNNEQPCINLYKRWALYEIKPMQALSPKPIAHPKHPKPWTLTQRTQNPLN